MTVGHLPDQFFLRLFAVVLLATAAVALSTCRNPAGSASPRTKVIVYVTNENDDSVTVIDGNDEVVLGTIGVGNAPRGIATNPTTRKSYVANYGAGTVTVFDGMTNLVLKTITLAGTNPQMVGINPSTNKVYVAYEYYGDYVEIIDGGSDTVSTTYSTSGNYPVGIGPNPASGKIYVVLWGDSSVDIIDAASDLNAGNITPITSDYDGGIAVRGVST